jgi:Bacterial Ig-like domain (group 3)
VRFRGVLLFLVGFFSALASSAVAAPAGQVVPGNHQAAPRVTASPLGIPFPASRDPQQWQAWHQRVRAQLEARRNTRARANASGKGSSGIIETIAGAVPFQKPVNALQTGFGFVPGIVEDSAGNLYVASCDLGVVLKVDPSSNTTVYAGRPLAVGPATSTGDGGPATSARLPCPSGLAMDTANNLYISDNEIGTVRAVDGTTGIIQTIAGTPRQFGHSGDGGPGTAALLEYPTGVALDGQGNLFIEDLDYLWRLNLTTGIIQTLAGVGASTTGCNPSVSQTCAALETNFYFLGSNIAVSHGYLYAAPLFINYASGSLSPSVVRIGLSSGIVQLLAGGGASAGTSTTYPAIGLDINPQGMTMDSAANVYIAGPNQLPDSGPLPNNSPWVNSIEELMAADNTIRVIAGITSPNAPGGDGGPATSAILGFPGDICLSPKGDVVFVDDFSIRSFSIGGNIATIAGNGPPNVFGDGGIATQAGLDQPQSVASDAQGNLYIADTTNRLVRKVDAVSGVITTVAGGGTLYGTAAEGAPALQTSLVPFDVALDQSNHLYIRDQYNGLKIVDLTTGTIKTLVAVTSMAGPMVFDGDKTLYYASQYGGNSGPNDELWAVDVTTGATTKIAGGDVRSPSGDGGPATLAGIYDVQGLALDGHGHLYLADNGFEDIRQIDLATGIISTIAGVHPNNPYITGYSGDGGPAVAATFNFLSGLGYDGAGHLTVVDSRNHVLRQIDLTTNIITTIAGNHTPGFGGDGGSPSAAMLYYPNEAAYDPAGNLFIADQENDRVRRVVLHPTKLNATLTYGGASSGGVTFTATYNGLSFGIAPTGTVTFLNGSTSLGIGTIAAATDGSGNYVATLTATSAPTNAVTITAQYSGDANYAALTTTAAFQPPTPSYTISAKPASLTVKQGASGSVTFTLTPQNGFNQAVSFQCDNATLPKGVTCSFSPASVTPNGTAAVTSTLTVQTTRATVVSLDRRTTHSSVWLHGGAALALLLFGIPGARRRFWPCVLMLIVFSVGGGIIGCGGGSGNTGGGTQAANATPPGAYSIQVTTSVSSSVNASPVTVSLTVTQ